MANKSGGVGAPNWRVEPDAEIGQAVVQPSEPSAERFTADSQCRQEKVTLAEQ